MSARSIDVDSQSPARHMGKERTGLGKEWKVLLINGDGPWVFFFPFWRKGRG